MCNKHIRCASCKYVRPDAYASEKNWTAYECGNIASEYYKALLNIRIDGGKLPWIVWRGCEYGELAERRDAV